MVFPSIIVADTPELVVTWLPVEIPVLNRVSDPENLPERYIVQLSPEDMMATKCLIVELNWHTSGTLRIKSPRAMWPLWMFWHPEMTAKPDTSMPTRHTSVRGWDSKNGICSWTYWLNPTVNRGSTST